MSPTKELHQRLSRPHGVKRLGQALWMQVGEPLRSDGLLWARALLGPDGDRLLWETLQECSCLHGDDQRLDPRGLAELLCQLWYGESVDAALLWTLPASLSVPGVEADSYVRAVRRLIVAASARLLLVAPYLEVEGIGQLQADILEALHRGVVVTIISHEANALGSWTSTSLESLRREATISGGRLRVYSAHEDVDMLLHAKLVSADGEEVIIGSANLTSKGLGRNLEAGVACGPRLAAEVERVLHAAISLKLVTRVFETGQPPVEDLHRSRP